MPTLTITKTYVDGDILTEADLDNIRTSIQTFFNTTGIDSTNIQAGGVAASDIGINDDEYLEFGTGNDFKIGVSSDDGIIQNVTLDQDILFKVNDGGVTKTPVKLEGSSGITEVTSLKLTGEGNANSNKIVNLTDGSSAQDAAAFGQIATAVTAAKANSQVIVHTAAGYGSTNNKIRIFSTQESTTGTAITRATAAADGDTFTINEAGVYAISYFDSSGGNAGSQVGISVNSNNLTTSIGSITELHRKVAGTSSAAGENISTAWTGILAATDVVRAHTDGNLAGTLAKFTITQLVRL